MIGPWTDDKLSKIWSRRTAISAVFRVNSGCQATLAHSGRIRVSTSGYAYSVLEGYDLLKMRPTPAEPVSVNIKISLSYTSPSALIHTRDSLRM